MPFRRAFAAPASLASLTQRESFARRFLRPYGIDEEPDVLYWARPDPDDGWLNASLERPGTGTRFNSQGQLETIPANVIRRDYDPVGGFRGALAEPQRTNLLLLSNADTLSTQSVTVTAEQHTLSFYGTGEVVLSGAHVATLTGTADSESVTLTFTPTAGSLTLTVTGTVRWANLEIGAFASSHIPTNDVPITRPADTLTIPQAGDRRRGFICWQGVMQSTTPTGSNIVIRAPFGITNINRGTVFFSSQTLLRARNTTSIDLAQITLSNSLQKRMMRIAYWWDSDANTFGVSSDGLSNINSSVDVGILEASPIIFGQFSFPSLDYQSEYKSHTDWILSSYNIPPIAQIEALTGGVL